MRGSSTSWTFTPHTLPVIREAFGFRWASAKNCSTWCRPQAAAATRRHRSRSATRSRCRAPPAYAPCSRPWPHSADRPRRRSSRRCGAARVEASTGGGQRPSPPGSDSRAARLSAVEGRVTQHSVRPEQAVGRALVCDHGRVASEMTPAACSSCGAKPTLGQSGRTTQVAKERSWPRSSSLSSRRLVGRDLSKRQPSSRMGWRAGRRALAGGHAESHRRRARGQTHRRRSLGVAGSPRRNHALSTRPSVRCGQCSSACPDRMVQLHRGHASALIGAAQVRTISAPRCR